MKKGLLATVIVGLVLAISLGIYTIVSLLPINPGYVPAASNFELAFRVGETINEFDGYSEEAGNFVLTMDSDEAPEVVNDPVEGEGTQEVLYPVVFDVDAGVYKAAKAGKATVVLTDANGDTKTYKITVYEHDATGTVDGVPYVICNVEHLMDYAALANNGSNDVSAADALKMDVALVANIDLAGKNWMPIGTCATPFEGTFEGNGYTISNMTISVTPENYVDYIPMEARPQNNINLGFFGKVVNSEILNLNFDSASIFVDPQIVPLLDSSAFDSIPGYEPAWVGSVAVGTVAGYMTRTTYTSTIANKNVKITNSVISGTSYNYEDNSNFAPNPSGLGSVAGVMSEGEISNVEITSRIVANTKGTEGSKVGGVVAYILPFDDYAGNTETDVSFKSTIDNVVVTTTVNTRYYLGAQVETATNHYWDKMNMVGLISAIAFNADIQNVTVKNSKILDYNGTIQTMESRVLPEEKYLAVLSGGVAYAVSVDHEEYEGNAEAFAFEMSNVNIENVFSNPAGLFGGVVAIASANTSYTDCYVSGLDANASSTGGFAYELKDGSKVAYTGVEKEYAIDAKLGGIYVGGFAVVMKGTFEGAEIAETASTPAAKTTIKTNITGYGSYIGDDFDRANNVVAAGFASYMYGTVENSEVSAVNFDVVTNINKSVNIVGLVGMLGETVIATESSVSTTRLDNINVEMTAKSYYNKTHRLSTTKIVSGAVGQIFDGATVNNVHVDITLNDGATVADNYGAAIFGGLVGHVLGESVAITSNTVTGNATIVEGNYWYRNILNSEDKYYIQIAGGLVGLIASTDYSDVLVSGLTIANNKVTNFNMSILGDFVYPGTTQNTGAIFFRVRGVGSLIGNINHTSPDISNTLNLSSNTITNVKVAANKAAFTYVVNGQANTEYILLGTNMTSAVGTTLEYITQDGYVNIVLPTTTGVYEDTETVA